MSTTTDAEAVGPSEMMAPHPKEVSGPWIGITIQALIGLLVALVLLVTYHFLIVAPREQRFAVVDLGEILALKELQVSVAASQSDSRDASPGAAMDVIAKFAKDLEGELDLMQAECRCVMLVRAAVIKPSQTDDLTQDLKKRLGLDTMTREQLVQQLRSSGGRGPMPSLDVSPK